MSKAEAKLIAEIVKQADGGCCVCVSAIAGILVLDFPEFDWAELTRLDDEKPEEWRGRVQHVVDNERWCRENLE